MDDNKQKERTEFEAKWRAAWRARGVSDARIDQEFAARDAQGEYLSPLLRHSWTGWEMARGS